MMSMSLNQMKAITRRFAVEPWSNGVLDVLDEVCAPSYTLGDGEDLNVLKGAIVTYRNAMPDLKIVIGEMVAEGDLVAYRWTMNGTHQGEFHGIAPTGKPVQFTGITIVRFADGKIVHDQFQSSSPDMAEQVS
jgi:predicted ester cyclase